jgi:hypothetical protein
MRYISWLLNLILITLVYSCEAASSSNPSTPAELSLAKVKEAISAAKAGETVTLTAGSATWDSSITITKGISIIGAGIGKTIITAGSDHIFKCTPDSETRANQYEIRISGFTFKGAPSSVIFLSEGNSETVPIRNVRIDHNRWENTSGSPIYVDGNFWGVVDNNEFAGSNFFMILGNQRTSWQQFYPVIYGTADNLYFEDNIFSGPPANGLNFAIESGQGGRWAFRHNTINTPVMENPMLDQHGFQSYSTGVYGLMLCEIYENTFSGFTTGVARWDYQRGGKLLMYNNTGTSTTGRPNITVNDARSEATPNDPYIYTPYDCYFFNNIWNSQRINATEGVDYFGTIQENLTFWNQQDAFNGSVGIGVGPLSARPSTCAQGVAYWATDTHTLYKATAPNTWAAYYKPYTYPHPLRK